MSPSGLWLTAVQDLVDGKIDKCRDRLRQPLIVRDALDLVCQVEATCKDQGLPIRRLDVLGHGMAGVQQLGPEVVRGRRVIVPCLRADVLSLAPLLRLRPLLAPGAWLCLLGCDVGRIRPGHVDGDGPLLGLMLARLLGCRVGLAIDHTMAEHFGPDGFERDDLLAFVEPGAAQTYVPPGPTSLTPR